MLKYSYTNLKYWRAEASCWRNLLHDISGRVFRCLMTEDRSPPPQYSITKIIMISADLSQPAVKLTYVNIFFIPVEINEVNNKLMLQLFE